MIGLAGAAAMFLAAAGLAAYSWPQAWLGQAGAFGPDDPALAFAALVLGAASLTVVCIIIGGPAWWSRRWRKARDLVASDVADDLDVITRALKGLLVEKSRRAEAAELLHQQFNDDKLGERLPYLSPGFTPEMSIYLSEYMERRAYISDHLATFETEDDQLLLFTDASFYGMREWRFSELPEDLQGADAAYDYHSFWLVFDCLGGLVRMAAEQPMGGWRTGRGDESVRDRARELLRHF